MACKCCQQYAPKIASIEPGAKKMTRTDPVAPCAGDAAIEEARKWAKIWRQRAIDCGWGNSTCNCGAPIAGNRGECDACFELEYPEHAKLAEPAPLSQEEACHNDTMCFGTCPGCRKLRGEAPDPAQVAQSNMTLDEKLAIHLAEALADGQEIAYCQGPKRHHVVVGSKFHDQLLERGCFHCGAFPEVAP